jgi:hypothetical protein
MIYYYKGKVGVYELVRKQDFLTRNNDTNPGWSELLFFADKAF